MKDFAKFGELVWAMIVKQGEDFCGQEISEDILPLAVEAGLCKRVAYDPAKHGEIELAEPGDMIWFWGEEREETSSPIALQTDQPTPSHTIVEPMGIQEEEKR